MMQATIHVPETEREFFGRRPILSKHNVHTTPYFDDSELVQIMDSIPRSNLRVWSADREANDLSSYMYVDTTGITGKDILDCVKRGKFWVNLQRVDKFFGQFKALSAELYGGLTAQCPHLDTTFVHSYILISSANMYFQLHVDSYENMFWCARGGKTFYLYPPSDQRVAPQEVMEDICAGVREDFLPHTRENESLRKEFRVLPGDLLSWPQHSPHEFINNDQLNVGLGTFHGTTRSTKRILNYQSSRYFRETMPFMRSRVDHDSFGMTVRRNLYRAIRKITPAPPSKKVDLWTSYRLDPEHPACLSKLDKGPVLAECCREAARLT